MFGVDDAVLAAGVTAAGSAIAGGASAVSAGKLNKRTMKFNQAEAEKQRLWNEKMWNQQNVWNEQMWNKQNEYNSPAAQVQRLREAGLNPLFYGLDGSSAGDLSAAEPLGYDRASLDNLVNPVASGLSAAAQIAQISNIQASTAKLGEETKSEVVRREQMQAEILNTKQELNNMLADEKLSDAKRAEIEKGLSWLDRLNESLVSMRESEKQLNQSQKKRIDELLEGEKLLQSKSIEDFDKKWQKISAEIAKMAHESNLLERDLQDYALNHMSNGFMGSGASVQNFVRGLLGLTENSKKRPQASEDVRKVEGDAAAMIYDNKY